MRCHICLGTIHAPYVVCECGKTFHESCSGRVNECPNCGRQIGPGILRPNPPGVQAGYQQAPPVVKQDAPQKKSRWNRVAERIEDESDGQ